MKDIMEYIGFFSWIFKIWNN